MFSMKPHVIPRNSSEYSANLVKFIEKESPDATHSVNVKEHGAIVGHSQPYSAAPALVTSGRRKTGLHVEVGLHRKDARFHKQPYVLLSRPPVLVKLVQWNISRPSQEITRP